MSRGRGRKRLACIVEAGDRGPLHAGLDRRHGGGLCPPRLPPNKGRDYPYSPADVIGGAPPLQATPPKARGLWKPPLGTGPHRQNGHQNPLLRPQDVPRGAAYACCLAPIACGPGAPSTWQGGLEGRRPSSSASGSIKAIRRVLTNPFRYCARPHVAAWGTEGRRPSEAQRATSAFRSACGRAPKWEIASAAATDAQRPHSARSFPAVSAARKPAA